MLTAKQRLLLDYLIRYIDEYQTAPSFDEMAGALNLQSKSGAHRLIQALEERGFIRRIPHRARAIEILRRPGERSRSPADDAHAFVDFVLRQVAAGGAPASVHGQIKQHPFAKAHGA